MDVIDVDAIDDDDNDCNDDVGRNSDEKDSLGIMIDVTLFGSC